MASKEKRADKGRAIGAAGAGAAWRDMFRDTFATTPEPRWGSAGVAKDMRVPAINVSRTYFAP
jgi:hypothetical protein